MDRQARQGVDGLRGERLSMARRGKARQAWRGQAMGGDEWWARTGNTRQGYHGRYGLARAWSSGERRGEDRCGMGRQARQGLVWRGGFLRCWVRIGWERHGTAGTDWQERGVPERGEERTVTVWSSNDWRGRARHGTAGQDWPGESMYGTDRRRSGRKDTAGVARIGLEGFGVEMRDEARHGRTGRGWMGMERQVMAMTEEARQNMAGTARSGMAQT